MTTSTPIHRTSSFRSCASSSSSSSSACPAGQRNTTSYPPCLTSQSVCGEGQQQGAEAPGQERTMGLMSAILMVMTWYDMSLSLKSKNALVHEAN